MKAWVKYTSMARSPTRSISFPVILASVAVALSVALLAGWIFVLFRNRSVAEEVAASTLFLIAGVVSLLTIISVLVMFSVFLVQQILEGRQQESFIDSVTHELKSPLASIKLCLETLPRQELTAEQREQLRQMMVDDVERLNIFIDDILEASRVNLPNRGYSLHEVDIRALLQRCVDSIIPRHHIPKEHIQIEAAEGIMLRTDVTALETIVKNLLDNAVKYSSEPREIRIRVIKNESKNQLIVEVQDNGIGLDPKHARRIFERFYRVQTEDVRTRRGTGLGLFVGAALAKSLGGRLSAHSEGPGKGTTMRLLLPTDVATS
jgi:signal transduction histidine kinase